MATITSKKKAPKLGTKKEQVERVTYQYEAKVLRVLDGRYGILFDLELNHVVIYGCRVCESKSGECFIGFPQKKGKNDDRYWSICRAFLSDDQTAEIIQQVADMLEEQSDDE